MAVTHRSARAQECQSIAAEIRSAADGIKDSANRASLLRIAIGYERLAKRLEAHGGRMDTVDGALQASRGEP